MLEEYNLDSKEETLTLEDLLNNFILSNEIRIVRQFEGKVDYVFQDDIPDDWLKEKVIDWEFSFGRLEVFI